MTAGVLGVPPDYPVLCQIERSLSALLEIAHGRPGFERAAAELDVALGEWRDMLLEVAR